MRAGETAIGVAVRMLLEWRVAISLNGTSVISGNGASPIGNLNNVCVCVGPLAVVELPITEASRGASSQLN